MRQLPGPRLLLRLPGQLAGPAKRQPPLRMPEPLRLRRRRIGLRLQRIDGSRLKASSDHPRQKPIDSSHRPGMTLGKCESFTRRTAVSRTANENATRRSRFLT